MFLYPIYLSRVDEIDSTNDFFKQNKPLKSWTILWADYQKKGKGAQGGYWEAERGKNLTFSIYLAQEIKSSMLFLLNMAVCNAIHKSLSPYHEDLWIKWPNDILLIKKKIAGILIENTIRGRIITENIIGIGLNVNQMHFNGLLSKASSLKKILQLEFDLEKLFMKLIENVQKEYFSLAKGDKESIKNYYLAHLYRKGEKSLFHWRGNVIEATICSVDENGQLIALLSENNQLKSFYHKEISLIY